MQSEDPTRINIAYDPVERRMVGIAAHGYTPFDVAFISQIDENLWQGGCEDGLILPNFIKHVVSLYPWESYTINHDLESSMTIKMFDSVENPIDANLIYRVADWINHCRQSGPVLVHCQAGLNRSSLVAARALMLAGASADEAIRQIREARSPACLCNPLFEDFLRGDV